MDHLKLCLMRPWSTSSHIWFVHLGMQFFVEVRRKYLLGFLCFIAFLFPPHWAPEDDQLIMLCLQVFLELLQPLATAGGLLRVVSVSSCSWYRLHPTQGTSESCQSRVLGADSDFQTQTMILLKLCSVWKPCTHSSQHPQLLTITGFATMLLSTR